MKISAILPYPVWVGTRNQLLVKVETDEGVFGWGESGLSGRERAVVGAIEHYREFLIGRDPMLAGALWQEMYRSQYFEGGRVLQAAISAIDIALHDIKGKALGVPVHQLLGGKQRDLIPTFATTSAQPGPEMIEQARALVEAGWRALRVSPSSADDTRIYEPREHIARTAEGCVKAREALGAEIAIGVDMHHRLSVAEAASFCQRMPSGTLDFLEEPIRDETPSAYRALRGLVDAPFAIGEEFASKWQFLPYIEDDLHAVQPGRRLQCRRANRGDESRRLERGALRRHDAAQPARARLHRRHRAFLGRGRKFRLGWRRAPRRSSVILGFDDAEFFPVQPNLEGAHYRVTDTPGLGVEVNEERVKKQVSASGRRRI